jgi:hypothetical protein
MSLTKKILFIQPFPIHGTGGGAQIMRFLIQNNPHDCCIVNSSVACGPDSGEFKEFHLPERPRFGPLERIGRLHPLLQKTTQFYRGIWRNKLDRLIRSEGIHAVHSVVGPDGLFSETQVVCEKLGLPHVVTIHDDNANIEKKGDRTYEVRLASLWANASHRYVICEEMGEEYNQRYAPRDYSIVTDGITSFRETVRVNADPKNQFYFTGLMHISYEPNFKSLFRFLKSRQSTTPPPKICSRGGYARDALVRDCESWEYRGFSLDLDYVEDTDGFDYLYLPLPFDSRYADFIRLSFSTKLITYLNLGIPIVYHGPVESALYKTLQKHDAALFVQSLDSAAWEKALNVSHDRRVEIVLNAQRLAKSRFSNEDILERFYTPLRDLLA